MRVAVNVAVHTAVQLQCILQSMLQCVLQCNLEEALQQSRFNFNSYVGFTSLKIYCKSTYSRVRVCRYERDRKREKERSQGTSRLISHSPSWVAVNGTKCHIPPRECVVQNYMGHNFAKSQGISALRCHRLFCTRTLFIKDSFATDPCFRMAFWQKNHENVRTTTNCYPLLNCPVSRLVFCSYWAFSQHLVCVLSPMAHLCAFECAYLGA